MSRKVRVEVDPDAEEEVVIRCRELTTEILRLKRLAAGEEAPPSDRISATLGDMEYFLPVSEIVFFESLDGKCAVHTADRMYFSDLRLYEFCKILPNFFMRVSKCCVLNLSAVSSLKRELTGNCEVFFTGSEKKVYVSRMYYKPFREALTERNCYEKT